MTTIVFSAVGAAVGTALFGPFGTLVGQAAGALAGNVLDATVLRRPSAAGSAPRLSDLTVQSAAEGRAIPRVFGRARIAGEIIWATEHEEVRSSERAGGKGGPPATTRRSYFANVAIGLCEGPIGGIARVFADGEEIDTTKLTIRLHRGDEEQAPDPLLAARQEGPVPAYRGLAYVVLERLPLAPYGNRLPNLAFEVIAPIDTLEAHVRAVTLIPGATEFGYATTPVKRVLGPGRTAAENRHVRRAPTDLVAALDDLQAACPNVERVALVVAWFGDDLRVGSCTLRPKVERADKATRGLDWSVAGLTRATALAVSTVGGRPAYGGTPSDASVIEAITELKARGLKVTLVPFQLMDVPAGNGRPDPTGGVEQPAHPWRGRITCHPAPGRPGTPDATAAVLAPLAAFVGTAAPAHFTVTGGAVAYAGPAEWTLRRQVLHLAALAKAAGGVDAFVIGSELKGLTAIRSARGVHPFVAHLGTLAADVRALLGPSVTITYAADWSEALSYRPPDGSGDHDFPLDPLWADPNVDVVGLDVYWPLADWRDGDHADADRAHAPTDLAYLMANVRGGEGFDWYHASDADRAAGVRTPITDGLGEPWIHRFKDLAAWWANPHRERVGGVPAATPTAFVPMSKPFWFTELGAPAVDRAANEPNVFPDPKSAEARLPRGSNGARDDLAQRRVIEAHLATFDPAHPLHPAGANPVSTLDGRRMVDPAGIHLWTWDARPHPVFPAATGVWADGEAWHTGHWLNGRLGGVTLDAVARRLAADAGVPIETDGLDAAIDGVVVDRPTAPRAVLEPLAAAFGFDATETATGLAVRSRARRPAVVVTADDLVEPTKGARLERRRAQESELPAAVGLGFLDALSGHARATVVARRPDTPSRETAASELAVVADRAVMAARAEIMLAEPWAARERFAFALPRRFLALEPGDVVRLALAEGPVDVVIERIEDGAARRIEARRHSAGTFRVAPALRGDGPADDTPDPGPPVVHVMDLAALGDGTDAHRPRIAVASDPWPGEVVVLRVDGGAGTTAVARLDRPAVVGRLAAPLHPGPRHRFDRGGEILVDLVSGHLAGVPDEVLFAGANRAAVQGANGRWETLRFGAAELVAPGRYRLTRLLRADGGSEDAWGAGIPAGAAFVLLDDAVAELPFGRDDVGREVSLRVLPSGADGGDDTVVDLVHRVTGRGLAPPPPEHLGAVRLAGGDVAVGFVRCARVGGDAWEPENPPLGEERELYRLEVLAGATVVRTVELDAPRWTYPAATLAADLGAPTSLTLRVAQIAPGHGAGVARTATLPL